MPLAQQLFDFSHQLVRQPALEFGEQEMAIGIEDEQVGAGLDVVHEREAIDAADTQHQLFGQASEA
jgi:hypothetical protein